MAAASSLCRFVSIVKTGWQVADDEVIDRVDKAVRRKRSVPSLGEVPKNRFAKTGTVEQQAERGKVVRRDRVGDLLEEVVDAFAGEGASARVVAFEPVIGKGFLQWSCQVGIWDSDSRSCRDLVEFAEKAVGQFCLLFW